MISFTQFESSLQQVQSRIAQACEAAGRAVASVALLPVTKNHPVAAVDYAARCGLPAVGENRVQEAAVKHRQFSTALRWELIGHLQSNKAKDAVMIFDRIQSVDSIKLLRRLDRFAGESGKCLPILLQCNTGNDPNKSGFTIEAMAAAMEAALSSTHLQVDGLMTIAPLDDSPEVAHRAFDALRVLRDDLASTFAVPLSELSMGMTGDLEQAIAAGSTQIRVGTALYGSRTHPV